MDCSMKQKITVWIECSFVGSKMLLDVALGSFRRLLCRFVVTIDQLFRTSATDQNKFFSWFLRRCFFFKVFFYLKKFHFALILDRVVSSQTYDFVLHWSVEMNSEALSVKVLMFFPRDCSARRWFHFFTPQTTKIRVFCRKVLTAKVAPKPLLDSLASFPMDN